jgi:hypothetical protein
MYLKKTPAFAVFAFAALLNACRCDALAQAQTHPPAQGPSPAYSGASHAVKSAHAGVGGCTAEVAGLAPIGEILGELRKLRAELLGFYVVAKQEKTSELELKVNELRVQRERVEMEERRATQHIAELDAQLGSATGEERERIEAEKSSRSGPALEVLRDRRASLGRREDDLRGLLSTEQQRLLQLKRLIAEIDAPTQR